MSERRELFPINFTYQQRAFIGQFVRRIHIFPRNTNISYGVENKWPLGQPPIFRDPNCIPALAHFVCWLILTVCCTRLSIVAYSLPGNTLFAQPLLRLPSISITVTSIIFISFVLCFVCALCILHVFCFMYS